MYGREFDCDNCVDVPANLVAQIVAPRSCVDISRYPVTQPVYHTWDGTSDPLDWSKNSHCWIEYDPEAVRWIAENVFHLSASDYESVLQRCLNSGAFYEAENEAGETKFFLAGQNLNGSSLSVRIQTAKSNGRLVQLTYDCMLWPNEWIGSYYAELERREGPDGEYWALYRHTEELPPFEVRNAPELPAEMAGGYYLRSPADQWITELTIHEDGSFTGRYLDQGAEENGDGYDQVIYYAEFEGRFGHPRQTSPYSYELQLEELVYLDLTEDYIVEEDNGWRVLYRYGYATGLEDSLDFSVYAPGAPMYKLPESFTYWYRLSTGIDAYTLSLPGWGLMNNREGQGFAGY